MKENDFLEENENLEETIPEEASAEETFDEIASAIGNLVEEELAAEEASEPASAEEDAFDAVSSAVEGLVEEEYADSVYPIDEEAYTSGEEIPHNQLESPKTGEELTADETAMESAGLSHPDDVQQDPPIEEPLPREDGFKDDAYRDPDSEEFQQMFDGAASDELDIPKHDRPAHKGRPKRKKGAGLLGIPHLIAAVIWLLIILAIGVSLGRTIWVCAADVLAFGRENKEVTVTITTDDSIEDIAAKLQDAGLIRYSDLFLLYADLTDVVEEGKITSGTFTLNTIYDYMALVNAMSPHSGSRNVVEDVLIPEGYSCRQIFALLEEKGICKASELEEYAASGELSDYWFLEGVERGDKYCLEGFLFPDTYDFYENSTPRQALEKMLNGFDYRFTEELYSQLTALNERLSAMMRSNGYGDDYIASNQMDLRKLITVASLIEEETSNDAESYKIASVIYNRLTNQREYPYLNIDAALFYALGEHKEALTAEDKQIDSPYNTYTHKGLVPGPISNPGLASLKAALNPEDTSYYYYVLDPALGYHDFSKTYEEHAAKVAEINAR